MNWKTEKSLDKCLPSYLTRVLSLYILLSAWIFIMSRDRPDKKLLWKVGSPTGLQNCSAPFLIGCCNHPVGPRVGRESNHRIKEVNVWDAFILLHSRVWREHYVYAKNKHGNTVEQDAVFTQMSRYYKDMACTGALLHLGGSLWKVGEVLLQCQETRRCQIKR